MIKLQVIGTLGRDCVVKEISGKNVINFSVAHSERYKDAQGVQKEKTIWAECAYWTDRTAIAPYLLKGQLVFVEGSPEAEAYMNKDNQPATTLRLRVSNIQLLGGSKANSGDQQNASSASSPVNNYASTPSAAPSVASNAAVADDLPF